MNKEPFSGLRRAVLTLALALPAILCLVTSSPAYSGEPTGVVSYRGIHPLFPHAGAFCYIDVTHVHRKRPSDLRVYRVLASGEHLFIGDPVALGYVGPTHQYFGPHPLEFPGLPASEKIYCYLRGAHFHALESSPPASFVAKADTYWYTGPFAPEFERDRHYLWINDAGAVASYLRPKVTIADAPAGYQLPHLAEIQPPAPVPTPGALGKANPQVAHPQSHGEGKAGRKVAARRGTP